MTVPSGECGQKTVRTDTGDNYETMHFLRRFAFGGAASYH